MCCGPKVWPGRMSFPGMGDARSLRRVRSSASPCRSAPPRLPRSLENTRQAERQTRVVRTRVITASTISPVRAARRRAPRIRRPVEAGWSPGLRRRQARAQRMAGSRHRPRTGARLRYGRVGRNERTRHLPSWWRPGSALTLGDGPHHPTARDFTREPVPRASAPTAPTRPSAA